MEKDLKDKINNIYFSFIKKINVLIEKRRILLEEYRRKLEEAKIEEIKNKLSK